MYGFVAYLVYETTTAPYLSLFLLCVLVTCYNDRIPYFLGLGAYKYKKQTRYCAWEGRNLKKKISKQSAESREGEREKDGMCRERDPRESCNRNRKEITLRKAVSRVLKDNSTLVGTGRRYRNRGRC